MRLNILNNGYTFGTKLLFAFIHLVSRRRVPDAARLVMYRPDFYGAPMGVLTQLAMRGPSAWSVGDRELMAAFVSKMNACAFCIGAHSATAAMAYQDEAKVQAVLSDLETAPIEEPLRVTLRLLGKLTREQTASADDMRAVLSAGVSHEQIEDALSVCFAFNTTNRLADTLGSSCRDIKTLRRARSFCSSAAIGSSLPFEKLSEKGEAAARCLAIKRAIAV